jgi:hypothetical protein
VFTLFSGAVGAGVLSLPKVVSYFGVAVGAVVIIFNALLAYASYWALFQAIMASGKKRYANLICYYLGTVNFASIKNFRAMPKFSHGLYLESALSRPMFTSAWRGTLSNIL